MRLHQIYLERKAMEERAAAAAAQSNANMESPTTSFLLSLFRSDPPPAPPPPATFFEDPLATRVGKLVVALLLIANMLICFRAYRARKQISDLLSKWGRRVYVQLRRGQANVGRRSCSDDCDPNSNKFK